MSGGSYITVFPDDGKREIRVFFYKLENLGIIKLRRERKKQDQYEHQWVLTEKGETLLEKNASLQRMWNEGKIQEFYNSVKTLPETE